ncbi:hypothetical protein G9A89_012620 [Geosiphon pyriformis]|nr:hypothetical protein G9A89_012620 [Geosiphon pyriformis]
MLHQQFNATYVFPSETTHTTATSSVPLSALGENPPSQLLSPAPSSPMSTLELRDSPTADELDVPEFFQYSKEKYESAKSGSRKRRKSARDDCDTASSLDGDEGDDPNRRVFNKLLVDFLQSFTIGVSHAEYRRQVHIQSEQKRRAEIKDGFEELRRQLPIGSNGRKMSKAALLQRTVTHLKNIKNREAFLVDEVTRLHQYCTYLNNELDKEKKMNAVLNRRPRNLKNQISRSVLMFVSEMAIAFGSLIGKAFCSDGMFGIFQFVGTKNMLLEKTKRCRIILHRVYV